MFSLLEYGTTIINFEIPNNDFVSIKIFDLLGREIKTLINSNLAAGKYTVTVETQNMTSGIYFYSINTLKFNAAKKLILLK